MEEEEYADFDMGVCPSDPAPSPLPADLLAEAMVLAEPQAG